MPEETTTGKELEQQLEDFKKQNPKVTQAMELFGMSYRKYQEILQAQYHPHIYQSTSTASMEQPNI